MRAVIKIFTGFLVAGMVCSAMTAGYAVPSKPMPTKATISQAASAQSGVTAKTNGMTSKTQANKSNPHPHLAPITWKGQKWEYLVEYPRDIRYIHPIRMEEVTDNAGQHGWKLVNVTSENHFYAFYFMRPLLAHKIFAHRTRLNKVVKERKEREAKLQKLIEAVYADKRAKQKEMVALKRSYQLEAQELAMEKSFMKQLHTKMLQRVLDHAQIEALHNELQKGYRLEVAMERNEESIMAQLKQTKTEIQHDSRIIAQYQSMLNSLLAQDNNATQDNNNATNNKTLMKR